MFWVHHTLLRASTTESLLAVSLDLLDDLNQGRVDLLAGLNTADLANNVLGSVLGHDGSQLLGLVVTLDVLETESHLDGVEQVLDGLVLLSKLGSGADEALLAGQLAERSATDTLVGILQVGVANALDDLVDVGGLRLLINAVLGDDEVLGLVQSAADLGHNVLVLQSIVDGALLTVVAVVCGSGVASVDSEELALDEGGEVVDPVDALDGRNANVLEGGLVNDPLEELLQGHIETGVGVLSRHDSVDGRVGVAGAGVVRIKTAGLGVLGALDELGESVGGTNGVLASNDVERSRVLSAVNTLGDDGSDEPEHAGTNGAGDDISGGNLLDEVLLVGLGVDSAVVCDGVLCGALGADLDHLVGLCGVDVVDERVNDIGEDDLIARVVQEAGDEATA